MLGGAAWGQFTQALLPETSLAFDQYARTVESNLAWKPAPAKGIAVEPGAEKSPVGVQNGLVHDWTASAFVPGASVERALALFQDYDAYKSVFRPEVVDSKLLGHDGNRWKAYLKLKRKKLVVTAVLDSEYDVEYKQLGPGRWEILSRSTKMNEVNGEKELARNEEHGYLWRMNAYWLLEQRKDGLYIACRSVSLSRDIPAGLGWAVGGVVSSLPKESLESTLRSLDAALRAEHPAVAR